MRGSMSGSGPNHVIDHVIPLHYEPCYEPWYVVLVVNGAMTMHWTMHEVPLNVLMMGFGLVWIMQ
jgi:hypothetical protein